MAKNQPNKGKAPVNPKKGGDAGAKKAKSKKKYIKAQLKPRLKAVYENEVLPKLVTEFKFKNKLAAPKIKKITINMGVGKAHENKKLLEALTKHISNISGQNAVVTKARTSIAGFKIRKGNEVGCKVTLRKDNMYFFLDKLISIAVPRVRDFRGIEATSFDGRGNFSMGLKEQVVFPEVDAGKIDQNEIHGMNICINISGGSNEQSRFLLKELGMPFKKDEKKLNK